MLKASDDGLWHSGYWVFGLCRSSIILKNTTFRKMDLFPSSHDVWETPTLLGPLERANLNQSSNLG
jgi:hypothetical protein